MERNFEQQLQGFQSIASQEAMKPADPEEYARIAQERAEALAEAVTLTQTDQETQEKVYGLQEKKDQILHALREHIRGLDDPSVEVIAQGRTVSFDTNTNTYLMRVKGGTQRPITLGEIATGEAWGQNYRLDVSVPRGVRKRHIVGRAHRQLHQLFNQQIAITEAESWFNKGTGKDEAYAAIARRSETPLLEQGSGVIAEQLVSSLLTRLAIDHELPYEVIESNAHADVEYKIDFIIRVKENDQGISVKTHHEGHDVPIQFTTKTGAEDIAHKQKQAARASKSLAVEEGKTVTKIVVVSVPVDRVKAVIAEWQEGQKNRVGGPDLLLPQDMQEKIFRGVLQDVFPQDVIERMWNQTNVRVARVA